MNFKQDYRNFIQPRVFYSFKCLFYIIPFVILQPEYVQPDGIMARFAEARSIPFKMLARNKKYASWALYATLFALYNAYWLGCLLRYYTKNKELEWCDGLGFLTILTIITYTGLFYTLFFRTNFWTEFSRTFITRA